MVGYPDGGAAAVPSIFFQIIPLYICSSSQSVQYTTKPATEFTIKFRCAYVMRGGKNPFVVLFISRCAEATGVVVPIPTFWACTMLINNSAIKNKNIFLIMLSF